MEELLKKLLEAEILSPETKQELETAFSQKVDEATKKAKANAEAEVRAELTEKWVTEKEKLVETIDEKCNELLQKEISELKSDIESFRDLEAEFAEKITEEKSKMSVQLQSDLSELVEKIDAFLEIRLGSELEELREDIDAEKRKDFGRRIFETFVEEYQAEYSDDDSVQAKLEEAQAKLEETQSQLREAANVRDQLVRKNKMEELLKPLSGRQREIMETVLSNIATADLDEGYKTFIGRVVKEETQTTSTEKEGKVLAETKSAVSTEKGKKTKVVTGNSPITETVQDESDKNNQPSESILRIRRLAGIGQD
jgi:hypothetical protein